MLLRFAFLLFSLVFSLSLTKVDELNIPPQTTFEVTMNTDRYFTIISSKFTARFSLENNHVNRIGAAKSKQLPIFGSPCTIEDHSFYLLGQTGNQLSSKIYELAEEGSYIRDVSNTKSLSFPTRIKTPYFNNGSHCFYSGGSLVRGGQLSDVLAWNKQRAKTLSESFVAGSEHSIAVKDDLLMAFSNSKKITILNIKTGEQSTKVIEGYQAGVSQKALIYGDNILVLSEVGSKIHLNVIDKDMKVTETQELSFGETGPIKAVFINNENYEPHILVCRQNCVVYRVSDKEPTQNCEDGTFFGIAPGGDMMSCVECKPGYNCHGGKLRECTLNSFQRFKGATVCQICFGKVVKDKDGHHIGCSMTSYKMPALLAISTMIFSVVAVLATNLFKRKSVPMSKSFI